MARYIVRRRIMEELRPVELSSKRSSPKTSAEQSNSTQMLARLTWYQKPKCVCVQIFRLMNESPNPDWLGFSLCKCQAHKDD